MGDIERALGLRLAHVDVDVVAFAGLKEANKAAL
jgi:hypothetical protein